MAAHDTWLEGVSSKQAIKAAREAKERAERLAASQAREEKSRPECLKALVETGLVRRDETVMDALKRLGSEKRRLGGDAKKSARNKKKAAAQNGGDAMDVDQGAGTTPEAEALARVSAQIDEISTLASTLLGSYGETDIYEESWDSIVKTLRLEGEVPRGWEPDTPEAADGSTTQGAVKSSTASTSVIQRPLIARRPAPPAQQQPPPTSLPATHSDTRYFYRWLPDSGAPPDQLGRSYGPFSHAEMISWVQGQYFGPSGKNIEVRRFEEDERAWRSWESARASS
jgi:CD2 antigen cytoplasmic tail-binding protein 2